MRLALLFATLLVSVAHAGPQKLAVLELVDNAQLGDAPARYLTDRVRGAAAQLDRDQWFVLTRENLMEVLPPGTDLAACEGDCEVETGRNIGADRVISGDITRLGSELRITLRLHDTQKGALLAQTTASAQQVEAFDEPLSKAADALLAQLRPQTSQATGGLRLNTQPDVTLTIDGIEVGHGPTIDIERLVAGRHTIELRSACRANLKKTVHIEPGQQRVMALHLQPQQATLTIESVDADGAALPAKARVDGKNLGATPGTFQVPVCAKKLTLRAGRQTTHQALTLNAEHATTLTVMLAPALSEAQHISKKSSGISWAGWLMIYGLGSTGLGYAFAVSNKTQGEELQDNPGDTALRTNVDDTYKASMGWYAAGGILTAIGFTWWLFDSDDDDAQTTRMRVQVGPGQVGLGGQW